MTKFIPIALLLCLTACVDDDRITDASLQKMIDCLTPKNGLSKEQACSALNTAENRIYTCSTSRVAPAYCQTLSREEAHLKVQFDIKKPFGKLNLSNSGIR